MVIVNAQMLQWISCKFKDFRHIGYVFSESRYPLRMQSQVVRRFLGSDHILDVTKLDISTQNGEIDSDLVSRCQRT